MRLGEGEVKEYEYCFKKRSSGGSTDDVSRMTTLTNRRLVVTWKNAEHSYPLSKITAIKLVFERNTKLLVGGVILGLIGVSNLRSSPAGSIVPSLIAAAIIYFWWKGRTRLQIGQMGGNEYYTVSGMDDKNLTNLIDLVNNKLS